jgi:hypothetical protein
MHFYSSIAHGCPSFGIQIQAPALQAVAKCLTGSGKSPFDRSHGAPQLDRRLFIGGTMQVAERHWQPVAFRQPTYFISEQWNERKISRLRWANGLGTWTKRFNGTVPEKSTSRSPSGANGHPMKPWSDAISLLDIGRVPCQGQKCALERIFNVMLPTEDRAAHRENHRTVPIDQSPECIRVVAAHKAFKNLPFCHWTTLQNRRPLVDAGSNVLTGRPPFSVCV